MAAVYLKGYILPLISECSDREVESYKTMSICFSINISPTNETKSSPLFIKVLGWPFEIKVIGWF